MRCFKSQNFLRHTTDYSTVLIIEPHFNKISKVLLLFYSLYWPGQMEIFFPFFNQPFSFSSLISHARLPPSHLPPSLSLHSHSLASLTLFPSHPQSIVADLELPPPISPLSTSRTEPGLGVRGCGFIISDMRWFRFSTLLLSWQMFFLLLLFLYVCRACLLLVRTNLFCLKFFKGLSWLFLVKLVD